MANRRVQEVSTPPAALEIATPSAPTGGWRLRHWLLMCLVLGFGTWIYPRGKAAWQLHDRATAMADYALCAAGPVGPSSLLDHPSGFVQLMRARLLVASPDAQPFAACTRAAKEVLNQEAAAATLLSAATFSDYGMVDGAPVSASLAQLVPNEAQLGALLEQAWPFERGGYRHLVKSSLGAKEALHPVEFPNPGLGHGLPGFRTAYRTAWHSGGRWFLALGQGATLRVLESRDEGATWEPTTLNQPRIMDFAGRCRSADERSQVSFTIERQEDGLYLHSYLGAEERDTVSLVGVSEVLAMSCDVASAVLGVENTHGQRTLLGCRYGGGCYQIPADPRWVKAHFDVAQVQGTTVLATVDAGVVRVRTSRDSGRSWTPATVAFDWQAHPNTTDIKLPNRLLALGDRVLLYGAAEPGQTYPVLTSDNQGASFHAPIVEVSETSGPQPFSASR